METKRLKRLKRLIGAFAATALLVTACGDGDGDGDDGNGEGSGGEASSDSGEPLRIGLVTAVTGTFGPVGEEVVASVEYAVDEVNEAGGIDGREVEFVLLETDGEPATTRSRVERALEREDAPFIIGPISSAETLAVADRVEAGDGIFFNSLSTPDALLDMCNERVFYTVTPNSMILNALSTEVGNLEAEEFSVLAADYATGQEMVELFTEAAEAEGKTVNEPNFAPLGTTEFAPQIAALESEGADGLFVVLTGGDAIAFTQQAQQFGLLDQYDSLTGYTFVLELTFPAQGEAVDGYVGTYSWYGPEIDTERSNAFEEGFTEANDAPPTFPAANVYDALQSLFQAVEGTGSVDPETVAEHLRTEPFDSILGDQLSFREGDQLLQRPKFVGQIVTGEDGTLSWETISEVPFDEAAPDSSC